MSHKERVALIDRTHPSITLASQARLLSVSRSSVYYEPVVNHENIRIMHTIDEIFTECPFYGSRRVKVALEDYGVSLCREHIQRLMRAMGLYAIYPKKRINISVFDTTQRKYPYLLRGLQITHPNHVWGADITYVRLHKGFAYLVAIIDWFSRYVIAFELSPTLDTQFCKDALSNALTIGTPDIHNSDQGTQFTDHTYTSMLLEHNVQISMDGLGRCMDNIFTERLWRSVKYEDVYLKAYHTIHEAQ